ncbi:hypothetical protein K7432_015427 [Basidiobolus ranarum]|uniref:Uncharacterized protein n=1 Tax=Basidiobolus ranarum TaxID=34480 RepID=A0ABR2VN90_9FUNG
MFPTVRSPSPVRTITPPSSITNGRIFRGRELNFFGRSSNSNETPNSRPQLPSGILEVASGTEFPSIKKVTSNNLVDRSTSPVLVDGRSRNSSMSSQRISFASRFEPFSGWSAKGNNNK